MDIHRAAGAGIALNDTTVHGEAGTLRRSAVVYTHRAGTICSIRCIGMIFNAAAVHDHLGSLHNAHGAIASPPVSEISGNGTIFQFKVGTVAGQIHRRVLPMSADFVPGDLAVIHHHAAIGKNPTAAT